MNMDRYKFEEEHSRMIVGAIVEGYREYIEHRKDRKEKMKISSAFAWTKGNFIESKIADICMNYGFTYKKSKAGLTWDYLQFVHGNSKILFLIKNAAYFNDQCFSQAQLPVDGGKRNGVRRTYLYELAKINSKLVFPEYHKIFNATNQMEQLSWSLCVSEDQIQEELLYFQSQYNEFHILTYQIDDAYQISKIMHYLPNPEDNIAYPIEDLSNYILGAELTDEDRKILAPEGMDELDPDRFDIGILTHEQINE